MSEEWSAVTKSAVAENILNLTRLDDSRRDPGECARHPVLWLALASLCVLDRDHVEGLTSSNGEWNGGGANAATSASADPPPAARPTCDNHDDGETLAIIVCDSCGNLCGDCDRFLHLHRRTKDHQRQVQTEDLCLIRPPFGEILKTSDKRLEEIQSVNREIFSPFCSKNK